MKANPGGQIDLSEVVGRDEIIEQIWDTLEQQSIRMNAERRIGKTTLLKKLQAEPRANWIPIFQDLEKCHSTQEFAEAVYREVEQFLSMRQKTARRASEFWRSLAGTEVSAGGGGMEGSIKLPATTGTPAWKTLLTKAVEDLVDEHEKLNHRPLFLWDEVPLMLEKISKTEGERVAMEVLDTLRALRQEQGEKGLRMILTGSIGFHHVIHSLKLEGYANSPLNDTYSLEVPPLDLESACELAEKLIAGEGLTTEAPKATAEAIAVIADCFPYYIHHIVKALKLSGKSVTPDAVENIVSHQLLDANDPWELNHYQVRIPIYYGAEDERTVLEILDGVAVRQEPVAVNELLAELKNMGVLSVRNQLISLLKRVEQDHYLMREAQGLYQFKFALLKRWWKLSRGL